MSEAEVKEAVELPLEGAGQALRRAREEKGLSLKDIADRTRITMRYLELIEDGRFSGLPGRTYAIGFSRSYARAIGLDENAVLGMVRAELAEREERDARNGPSFEPGDPAKLPPRGLVWASGVAVFLLLVGTSFFFARHSGTGEGPAPLTADVPATQVAITPVQVATLGPAAATPPAKGQVVFTALEDGIWVRFYDSAGNRLFEKQMAVGESFAVPPDAQAPKIWTGRPDALGITIGGQSVPRLANEDVVMRDVSISADALLARLDSDTIGNGPLGTDRGATRTIN